MYNTPILTPEDRVEQAIDISDGYSGVYGTPANDLICDAKSDYWIGNTTPCNIYKGPFPNKEEIIMTCSRESTTGVYSPIDELVFKDKGIVQAELRCEKEDILEKRITLSLRSQQKELGLVYRYHDTDTINYYPLFRLVSVPEGCCYGCCYPCCDRTTNCFTGLSLGLGVFSIILLAQGCGAQNIIMILIAIIFFGTCFPCLFSHYCFEKCRQSGVHRLHKYSVVDMNTCKLVAKVYKVEIPSKKSHYTEFSCRREMTRSQLMGLFSLVMLNGRVIYARS